MRFSLSPTPSPTSSKDLAMSQQSSHASSPVPSDLSETTIIDVTYSDPAPLYACTRCYKMAPFEALTEKDMLCQNCVRRLVTVRCVHCRLLFQEDCTQSAVSICADCKLYRSQYGLPGTCKYCQLVSAFSGPICARCYHYEGTFGAPVRCGQCKLWAAFGHPTGNEWTLNTGPPLCWHCSQGSLGLEQRQSTAPSVSRTSTASSSSHSKASKSASSHSKMNNSGSSHSKASKSTSSSVEQVQEPSYTPPLRPDMMHLLGVAPNTTDAPQPKVEQNIEQQQQFKEETQPEATVNPLTAIAFLAEEIHILRQQIKAQDLQPVFRQINILSAQIRQQTAELIRLQARLEAQEVSFAQQQKELALLKKKKFTIRKKDKKDKRDKRDKKDKERKERRSRKHASHSPQSN